LPLPFFRADWLHASYRVRLLIVYGTSADAFVTRRLVARQRIWEGEDLVVVIHEMHELGIDPTFSTVPADEPQAIIRFPG
jgi:hypothetical protein